VLKLSFDIYFKTGLILFVVFVAIFIAVIFFLECSLKELFVLGVAWSVMFGGVMIAFGYLHLKLKQDTDALRVYLQKLEQKNYKDPLKVHNYMEFLEIALLLKNLVKRLYYKKSKHNVPKK
jgi:hypothetical protein